MEIRDEVTGLTLGEARRGFRFWGSLLLLLLASGIVYGVFFEPRIKAAEANVELQLSGDELAALEYPFWGRVVGRSASGRFQVQQVEPALWMDCSMSLNSTRVGDLVVVLSPREAGGFMYHKVRCIEGASPPG